MSTSLQITAMSEILHSQNLGAVYGIYWGSQISGIDIKCVCSNW